MKKLASPEDWFHLRATHYVETQILFNLNQVGVFELLFNDGAHDLAAIAKRLKLREPVVAALLDYVLMVDALLSRSRDGKYRISPYGRKVLLRYGRKEGGRYRFNFFDVRAGGYGPVWAELSGMMTGAKIYGQNLHRAGEFAADGLYKSSVGLVPALARAIVAAKATTLVELGVETGLLARVSAAVPATQLYGLDRNKKALALAADRAQATVSSPVRWIESDVFEPAKWSPQIAAAGRGVFFSAHFHEFMAVGIDRFQATLRAMKKAYPGWRIVALEQPRIEPAKRASLSDSQWLYSQSNVLIHHLIGNGQILTKKGWTEAFTGAGLRLKSATPTQYLGYLALVFEL